MFNSNKSVGEFYFEYDEATSSYCVFHTDTDGKAYGSFSDELEAKDYTNQRNGTRKN